MRMQLLWFPTFHSLSAIEVYIHVPHDFAELKLSCIELAELPSSSMQLLVPSSLSGTRLAYGILPFICLAEHSNISGKQIDF